MNPADWGIQGDVEDWTYAIVKDSGEHKVFLAPKQLAPSPAQLAGVGLAPEEVRIAAGGTLHTTAQGTLHPKIVWAENNTDILFDENNPLLDIGKADWHDDYVSDVLRQNKPREDILVIGEYTRERMARIALVSRDATYNLYRGHWLPDNAAQAYGLTRGWDILAEGSANSADGLFEAKVGLDLIEKDHRVVTAGDDAIRRALGLPQGTGSGAVDLVTVDGGKLVLTEAKHQKTPDFGNAIAGLEAISNQIESRGFGDKIGALQIYVREGVTGANGYSVVNGYLVDAGSGVRELINGYPVKVIQLSDQW